MKFNFLSRVDNFYNPTIDFLVNEKLRKLVKYNLDGFTVYHKIRDNGNHKVKLSVGDYFAKAENKYFETVLIEVVENIERQHIKEKDYVSKKKRDAKKEKSLLEKKIEEEMRLLAEM